MAQPIELKIAPRDPKQELMAKLEAAPEEYAAALLDSYETLQALHEKGVFTTLRGVLGAGEKIVETATSAANREDSIRAMRNAILLGQILAAIDPIVLEGTLVAVKDTWGNARNVPYDPPSLVGLFSSFLSKDFRRGMGLINLLLKNLAYQLKIRTMPGGTSEPTHRS